MIWLAVAALFVACWAFGLLTGFELLWLLALYGGARLVAALLDARHAVTHD